MNHDPGCAFIREYMHWLAHIGPEGMLFRGHADAGWNLVPSAFRPNAEGITEGFTLGMWIERARKTASPRPHSNLEWLVLAQHYGIPTNLLDWTSNPLTALYFAAQSTIDKADGKVHAVICDAFREPDVHALNNPFCVTVEDGPFFINVSAMNVRSMAQDGYMTVHCSDDPDITDFGYNIETFEVPEISKLFITQSLNVFGFSEDRLYTDLGASVSVFKKELSMFNNMRNMLDN